MNNKERAQRIKMILMDVDGTLTDGSLFVLPDGREIKSYHVRDGMGILMARLAGFKTGIITGKTSEGLKIRAEKLKVVELYQGIIHKKKVFFEILDKHSLQAEETAYIGDDLGDLPVIKLAGFSGAVADAHIEIKKYSHFICRNPGGKGAVREFIEFIFDSQNKWPLIEKNLSQLKSKDLF